ncbi:MAG TPA: chondroitinase-B domain-containing protein [Paludibacteraceae bacterium]|nr:chondroitinase-B domain-containing protein [Paludibacteraceae bacterium]
MNYLSNITSRLTVILIFLMSCVMGNARQTVVTNASAINNGTWTAGDTIVMKNGTWINQSISFKATGNASQPVVLMAETPGKVILNGTSKFQFSGKYIVVSGLYFKDGILSGSDVISFRTSSSQLAENCRLTNTVIENYNPSDNAIDSKWISIYGKNNKVDHCSFVNKTNSGTLMVVWLTNGVTVNHEISDNYFGYRNPNLDANGNELNGQEIIRIGDSSTSMTTAGVIVSGNFFEHCNGEIETISNKSCGNIYTNNLFLECKGTLTLRHGNNCTVAGNYFFGNGISNTGGVRIIGENHKVYNNYFENLRGTNYRAALCIVRGKENSALNEYFQVKNATIAFNTFVNCSQSFRINYNSSSSFTMPPVETVIAHNHVYNTSSSYYNVSIDLTNITEMDVTWKNNLMNIGRYTNFPYDETQVITGKDAKMNLADTPIPIYEPSTGSELTNYTTSDYPEITKDIRGRERNSMTKLPGASEITGIVTQSMPIKTLVGATFYNNPDTKIVKICDLKPYNFQLNELHIIFNPSETGYFYVIDLSGKILFNTLVYAGTSFTTKILEKGIYILLFKTPTSQYVEKIVI